MYCALYVRRNWNAALWRQLHGLRVWFSDTKVELYRFRTLVHADIPCCLRGVDRAVVGLYASIAFRRGLVVCSRVYHGKLCCEYGSVQLQSYVYVILQPNYTVNLLIRGAFSSCADRFRSLTSKFNLE